MTRDFLISFDTIEDALSCEKKLSNILVDDSIPLFEEIDNRGKDIFVVLTYPNEIKDETYVNLNDVKTHLKKLVNFVAIKNGEHQGKGFAYYSKNLSTIKPDNNSHISAINETVLKYFKIPLD